MSLVGWVVRETSNGKKFYRRGELPTPGFSFALVDTLKEATRFESFREATEAIGKCLDGDPDRSDVVKLVKKKRVARPKVEMTVLELLEAARAFGETYENPVRPVTKRLFEAAVAFHGAATKGDRG